MQYWKKILDSDTYYVKYEEGTNVFRIRKDKNQTEKDSLNGLIEGLGKKLNKPEA